MSEAILPVRRIAAEMVSSLKRCPSLVLRAPTGSGKSTQVPRILEESGLLDRGEVVVLEPRRLATRLLARRVAGEYGEKPGGLVGYQIRHESMVSNATRIRYVTEGLLLRQMTENHDLAGIQALVFDEFHERNIYSDVCLARARQIQQTRRPDLLLIVMSATLTSDKLADFLGGCPVCQTEDRSYPVAIDYLEEREYRRMSSVAEEAARQAARVIREGHPGHLLIFMPGGREIRQTLRALEAYPETRTIPSYPLYGELPPAEQDRAVQEDQERKIIVATNVAETSLTIPGVGTVIDGGQARIARYDPGRGINTLLVEKISRSSADQRAGRAGRTQAGRAIRLWSETDHQSRAAEDTPEIRRIDLAELMLWIKASREGRDLTWFESPPEESVDRALTLLGDLGALDRNCDTLTDRGRKMLRFPLHPRYAALLLAAADRQVVPAAALMAALVQGRDLLLRRLDKRQERQREDGLGDEVDSDLFLRMRAWLYAWSHRFGREECAAVGIQGMVARETEAVFRQLLDIAGQQGLWKKETALQLSDLSPDGGEMRQALAECILTAFSDHVGYPLGKGTRRYAMVGGKRGDLANESVVNRDGLMVAGEIAEISGGRAGEVTVLLSLVTAIEEAWLRELFPDDFRLLEESFFDEGIRRVVLERRTYFRDLLLTRVQGGDPSENQAAVILAREVKEGRAVLKNWTAEVDQLIARIKTMAKVMPEWKIPTFTAEDEDFLREQVCFGAMSVKEIKDRPVLPVLRQWLSAEQWGLLDHYCPESLVLPNGRSKKLHYRGEDESPLLSARIQELYDLKENQTVADGRLPIAYQILAPNQRPVQMTANLKEFWVNSYPAIRKELKGRYPKHEWR